MTYRPPYSAAALRHPAPLLGGLSPARFMADYWHKKPLLIRGAAPQYIDRFPVDDLFELASYDDVESRLVRRTRGRWQLERGPIDESVRKGLGKKDWSLLVQGVNLHDDDASDLLAQFRFIPDARLDDLMVSFAPDGGGVGPHFDSYDVFLLQTHGRRRWQISEQRDLTLDPTQPMKILQHFQPEQEWILEPGDMLYLPPHVAHDGVALGDSITCSIGFRAPSETELVSQFLMHMAERISADDPPSPRYRDPEQEAVTHPAALPKRLMRATMQRIAALDWQESDVSGFLGQYLSEPKPHVFFDAPARMMKSETFIRRSMARGLRLDPKSQLLYDGSSVFINGEAVVIREAPARKRLFRLADERVMNAEDFVTLAHYSSVVTRLHEWYLAGWIHFA